MRSRKSSGRRITYLGLGLSLLMLEGTYWTAPGAWAVPRECSPGSAATIATSPVSSEGVSSAVSSFLAATLIG